MDCPKIDIYVRGQYVCSTQQSKTLAEAKEKFLKNPTWATVGKSGVTQAKAEDVASYEVVCRFAEDHDAS